MGRAARPAWGAALPRLLASVLALLVAGCGRDDPPPNVIFVLVDSVRADFLSVYGQERQTSPHLDALAEEGIVFETHASQASCTYPSMNSLFTSRSPSGFLKQPGGSFAIPPDLPTLAEVLQENGFATFAVSASPIVRNRPSQENPFGGFAAGFDVFHEQCLWGPAECVNEVALHWMDDLREPFFLYLHYMDPHAHYSPPKTYQRRFSRDFHGKPRFIRRGNPGPLQRMLRGDIPSFPIEDEHIEHLRNLYADEIAYFDATLAELLEELRARELLDASILVIASDHGQAFLEHGLLEHCNASYEPLARTPLIVRLPGGAHAGRRRALTRNLDIFPTLLDLLEIDREELDLLGSSLLPVIERDHEVNDYVLTLGGRDEAIRDRRFKLIFDFTSEEYRLFDLQEDPGETRDASQDHPEVAARLREELDRRMRVPGRDGLSIEERLRALGYLD